MKRSMTGLGVLAVCLQALSGWADGPSFFDNFDADPLGTTFITPLNGWTSPYASVVVTNDYAFAGSAVRMPEGTALTNTVNGGSGKVIWTDCYLKPVLGEMPENLPTNTMSACVFLGTNGYANVLTAGGWRVYTNDIWGNALAPVGANFAHIAIYQDFSRSNLALLVNGRLAVQDLRFPGAASAYNTLSAWNPTTNAWLDNVWIKTNYDAATLTNDVNADGMSDAGELAMYGYASRILYAGAGSGYPGFATIQSALNAWRTRDSLYVYAGQYAEDVIVSNNVAFGGQAFTNSGSLTIGAGLTVALQNATVWSNITIGANAIVAFNQPLACSNLYVGANATVTFNQAVACAAMTVDSGATVTANGTIACSAGLSVAQGAFVALNQSGSFGVLSATGTVTLAAGRSLTLGAATVYGSVLVTGASTVTVASVLSVPTNGSGHLDFSGGQFVVASSGVNMTGTFSITNTWGQQAAVGLPFADDFETYTAGTRLSDLGFRGWGASDPGVTVQSGRFDTQVTPSGTKAVALPSGTLFSNRITTAAGKVWTDFYLTPLPGEAPDNPPTNSSSFFAFVDSNGCLEVATGYGWVVCTNTFGNGALAPADAMNTQTWTRISLCQNFTNHTFSVFLNGKLLREQLAFPGGAIGAYHTFGANNQNDGTVYMDDIAIGQSIPVNMTVDLDGDGIPDAYEIDRYGTLTAMPVGSVFKFR